MSRLHTSNDRSFYNWLVGYLDGCDPIDLIIGSGCPPREYGPEAEKIFDALPTMTAEDAPRIVHEVFLSMFDDAQLVGDIERYRAMAIKIFQAWEMFGNLDLAQTRPTE